jgi:phage baseplate assembly protein V
MRGDLHETERTLGDIARLGTVASIDRAAARITVRIGDAITGPIPWLSRAHAAGLSTWFPPGLGEQVLLICPEGEIAAAIALPVVFSTANPAPASDGGYSFHFGDGAVIRYDPESGALTAILPAGATATITAPGGITLNADAGVTINGPVTINGDASVNGKITATGDVIGQGKSLATHKHIGVATGSAQSGIPA